MAFVFPEDKDDFRAPNGVVYKWDGTKWIVKAFRSTDDFLVTLDDDAPDEPKKGDLWFDTKADELTLYLYTGTEWVPASPPVSLDGIEAQINDALIIQDDLLGRVAAGEIRQQQIETTIADALAVQGAIQDEQGVQNNQINALETQVQLLAGVRAVGRWTYRRRVESNSPRPPATAAFYGTHKDNIDTILLNWSDINLLMINKTDIDGNIFTFSDFEEGDKVEVIASDGSSACYGTVTNDPSNDVYANMIVAVERSNSGPVEEKEYLISAYRPGSSNGEVDLDILDGRYLVKTGDVMSGPLNFKRGEKDSNQFKISPNVDDYFTNLYAYNSGGMRFRVTPGDTDVDYKTVISASWSSHVVDGQTYPVELAINWLRNPTQPHHAANKAYVDATAGSGGGMQLDLWTYKGTKSDGNSLGDGEFASKKLAGNVLELYLGRRNSRGVFYHPTPSNSTSEYYHQVTQSSQNGSPLTVTQQDGRCVWFAETKKLIFNKGSANYSVIEAIHYRGAVDLLIEGNQYMLNIPGLIGPVSGWS